MIPYENARRKYRRPDPAVPERSSISKSEHRAEPEAHRRAQYSSSARNFNTFPVTRVIPYSRRAVGHPWDGANNFSEPISLTLVLSFPHTLPLSLSFLLKGVMDHEAHVVDTVVVARQTSSGLTRKGWRHTGLPCPRVLALLPLGFWRCRASTPKNERRRRRAATHNCVSTRSVCGRLDNVMNVDIFPNADITYYQAALGLHGVTPLLSSRLVVPSR